MVIFKKILVVISDLENMFSVLFTKLKLKIISVGIFSYWPYISKIWTLTPMFTDKRILPRKIRGQHLT